MKNLSSALLAGALLTTGFCNFNQLSAALAQTAAPVSIAQKTWAEVRDNSAYLDNLIAQNKLAEVHEAAYNLRDSARMMRGADLTPAAKTQLGQILARIDALASDLDESGDKNDRRATLVNQRKMHLALDEIAALFSAKTLAPIGAITARGQVQDPVCRMIVDAATAPARATFGGQTYYFCSKGDAAAFGKSPAKYAALSDELAFGTPKTFTVSLRSDGKARALQPELLTLMVREKGGANVVKDFQIVHEKRMHLIVVSDDLTYFSHQHPQLSADGRFRLKWTPPRAGRYALFADFTPGNGLNQITKTQLTIEKAPAKMPHLVADASLSKVVDGFGVSVRPSAPMQVGHPVLLTYSLTRGGKPVTDMGQYLGASGHLMAIAQDEREMVHTHTIAAGGAVSSAMATPSGPRFTFDLTPKTAGLTKIWAQFQRGAQVVTVPFTFNVAPATNPLALEIADKAKPKVAPQKITIALPQGYKPGAATVKAGQPVALTFVLKSDAGCGNTIALPAAKWKKTLRIGERATVVYTPQKSGNLEFACGMGMFRGTVLVK